MQTKQVDEIDVKNYPVDIGLHWIEGPLAQLAFENGDKTLHSYTDCGYYVEGFDYSKLVAEIKASGARQAANRVETNYVKNSMEIYLWDQQGLSGVIAIVHMSSEKEVEIYCRSLDPAHVSFAEDLYKKHLSPRKKAESKKIFTVSAEPQGLVLKELGLAAMDFIDGNYTPEVVKNYHHIVKDLGSSNPCGRVVILRGEPGTGKSTLIRSLLDKVPNGKFVLIPSFFVSKIGDPSFVKMLLDEKHNSNTLILVLEDADECISKRDAGNLPALSNLLNFSDGIFGSMLDLRIICTTNADIDRLDEAVTREGRLCSQVEVGRLSREQAETVYKRITGEDKLPIPGSQFTLAQVYTAAKKVEKERDLGHKSEKKVGFI